MSEQHRFEGKQVVVFGGAGFVGSHLVDALLSEGAHVLVVDDLSTGRASNLDEAAKMERSGLFQFVTQDVTETNSTVLAKTFMHRACDVVFNLASPASPVAYHRDHRKTLLTNSMGTELACQLAVNYGHKGKTSFVQASTSEVYGDPLEHPQRETYWGNVNPVGPRACYDEGKRFAEALCAHYASAPLRVRIARIFNTYGPRMDPDDGRLIPSFVKAALHSKPMPLFGEGWHTRSLLYVSDLVEGLLRLALSEYSDRYYDWNEGLAGVVNLGGTDERTVMELAGDVAQAVNGNRTMDIMRHKPVKDDPKRRKPNIDKAWDLLGWKPQVTWQDGIARTVEWFRKVV